jgi:hypothetical protein
MKVSFETIYEHIVQLKFAIASDRKEFSRGEIEEITTRIKSKLKDGSSKIQ